MADAPPLADPSPLSVIVPEPELTVLLAACVMPVPVTLMSPPVVVRSPDKPMAPLPPSSVIVPAPAFSVVLAACVMPVAARLILLVAPVVVMSLFSVSRPLTVINTLLVALVPVSGELICSARRRRA